MLNACASRSTAPRPLPVGVIKEGSLANQKLIVDVATAATDRFKAKGHFIDPKGVPLNQYVVSMPTGTPGNRTWTERWVFLIEGKEMPVTIRFREDGLGAAHFTIEEDKTGK